MPSCEIFKEFTFEAAHRLGQVPPGHKCAHLHGHSYRVALHVLGEIGADTGWVTDFGDLSEAFAPLRAHLDHRYLNDIDGLDNPTSELLAVWIYERLDLPGLVAVSVSETATTGATYRP